MIDFMKISTRQVKKGVTEIFPKFVLKKSSDLMIRGGDFYAVWNEDTGLWSTDEEDVINMVDAALYEYTKKQEEHAIDELNTKYMWDSNSGSIDAWHKYCQKQMRDNYHPLDEKIIFGDTKTTKKDYASRTLSYPLRECNISGYEKLMSTLYSPGERKKIEWAIGAVIEGDSKNIQKFMVLYGSAGTGKSTVLNIIQQLFEGYYSVFDAKALGSANNSFALEAFKANPLIAIQHDGDLSKIEDNTRLNSLVSHELMTVNEKFKSTYANRFNAFLFMGTNKPVKITDSKSGLLRRLIDVTPSGNKLDQGEYSDCMDKIPFELPGIAYHCHQVYLANKHVYDSYVPTLMMGATNDFYNFMIDSFSVFKKNDGTTLKTAWEMYKVYCDETKVPYPYSQRVFKEELRNYFWNFDEEFDSESQARNVYSGFRLDKFEKDMRSEKKDDTDKKYVIEFMEGISSEFDILAGDYLAQYANEKETPTKPWDAVTTRLHDINVHKLHYVKVPENHIVIDFDIKDESGNKSFEKNLAAASKWPATYAELSKSGAGIHLHYIYDGDSTLLNRLYDKDIEIKVFTGKSSLRRKLTKCNDLPIAHISSGLPLKEGGKKVINIEGFKNEQSLRTTIKRNLEKEYHHDTRSSVDFINKLLNDAYASDKAYDVSDMRNAVYSFAAQSTNQADYCLRLVSKMKFKSEEPAVALTNDEKPLVFYDCEVFPNLFLVNWKVQGEGKPIVRLINPRPQDIEELIKFRLVGFNCRRYDNHMLYACMMGYTNEQLYDLSQKIVNTKKGDSRKVLFGEAYNISYTDIYDFASAGNKKSLKKLEIEMGIHHQELGLPWDKPVPKELWQKVAEYCDNDVLATEAAWDYLKSDFIAREILADLAGLTVNDTTNTLTQRFIFGNNKHPQNEFQYRNLAEPVYELDPEVKAFLEKSCREMMAEPYGEACSLLPYFPGYRSSSGNSEWSCKSSFIIG